MPRDDAYAWRDEDERQDRADRRWAARLELQDAARQPISLESLQAIEAAQVQAAREREDREYQDWLRWQEARLARRGRYEEWG